MTAENQAASAASGEALSISQAAQIFSGMLGEEEKQNTAQDSDGATEAQEAESTPEGEDNGEEQESTPEDKDGEGKSEQEDSDDKTLVEVTLPGGEKTKLTLEELAKGYSREADYTRSKQELAREKQTLQSNYQKELQVAQQERAQAANLLNAAEQFLLSQNSQITPDQWNEWEQFDPARFAAEKIKYQERQQQVQAIKAQREELTAKTQKEQQAELARFVESQIPLIKEVLPEVADPQKWEGKKTEIRNFMFDYGFSEAEVAQIYDARIFKVIVDAMKSKQTVEKKQVIAKKIAEAPRMVTPSAAQSKGERGRAEVTQARQRLRSTGKVTDAAAIFKNYLK